MEIRAVKTFVFPVLFLYLIALIVVVKQKSRSVSIGPLFLKILHHLYFGHIGFEQGREILGRALSGNFTTPVYENVRGSNANSYSDLEIPTQTGSWIQPFVKKLFISC